MLTCRNVSAEKAKDYYTQAYYPEGTSRWWGKGAGKLKLKGAVTNEAAFTRVLKGISPSGRTKLVGRQVAKGKERRAALDCTFNAPKSVTLQALVGGDERLLEAHRMAVNQTLELIQSRYSHTRVRSNGERLVVTTGNLIVAQFDHVDARKVEPEKSEDGKASPPQETPDPHLHTHCLIMNATEVERGKWYSHHNDGIFANRKLLGMVYQHYLAIQAQQLGYEVVRTGDGQFDLKGFRDEDLVAFSKRRQKILSVTGNHGTAAEREQVRVATRAWKDKVVPSELALKWRQEAEALGIEFIQPEVEKSLDDVGRGVDSETLEHHLNDAISHCAERQVAFKPELMEQFVLSQAFPTDVSLVEQGIVSHPDLIKVAAFNRNRYTTQQAVQREMATIRLMRKGKQKVRRLLSQEVIEESLSGANFTEGQKQALQLSLSTSDQFIAWQGVAGAGKTYALRRYVELARSEGFEVKGFAPSAEAAKVLSDEVGIETNTVASHLLSTGHNREPNSQAQSIWIIDETGLLSAQAAYELLQRATKENARIIFVGDTRQLSGIEAGNPFKSLQQRGMATAYLDQSLRQRTPQLHLAVSLVAQGLIEEGFEQLAEQGCLKEVDERDRVKQMATDYLALSEEQRNQTLLLAGTNQERLALTQQIRSGLRAEGRLTGSAQIKQLKAKALTKVQLRYAHHYELGDVIVPLKSYVRRGLEKGQSYVVVAHQDDKVTVQDPQGRTMTVDLGFEKVAFSPVTLDIAEGDCLKWTKNERQLGRRNGQRVTVLSIKENKAVIELEEGKTETIDLTEFQHLDYALVSTTYSSQGKTAERVMIVADETVSQESFYVAVSRVRRHLSIYTSDKEALLAKAMESKAKENALELLIQSVDETIPEGEEVFSQRSVVRRPITKNSASSRWYESGSVGVKSQLVKPLAPILSPIREGTQSNSDLPQVIDNVKRTKWNKPPNSDLPSSKERRRQLYRLTYQDLANQVRKRPDFAQASSVEVDIAISYEILTQPNLGSQTPNYRDEIEQLLSQSPTAVHWQTSLSPEDYRQWLTQYVNKIYGLVTYIEAERQKEELNRKGIEKNLELGG